MYVARRAFRNYNQMILPGSIVEPAGIKWFKTRLKDRVIIEVTPQNFSEWNEYFKQKFGVSLKELANAVTKGADGVTVVGPVVKQTVEPAAKPVKEPVKVTVKASVNT